MDMLQIISHPDNKWPASPVDLKAGVRAISRTDWSQSLSLGSLDSNLGAETESSFTILTEDGLGSAAAVYPISSVPRILSGRHHLIDPNVKKIAILRSNGIGDFIFTLPALEALRMAYPNAEIVLLALDWHADFLRNRPSPIDRVVVVPRCRGVNGPEDGEENPQELERFFQEMVQENFDIAIQMHGGGRFSNPFIRRLGARLTAGACSENALPLDRCIPYYHYQMEILRYLEIASLVGAFTTYFEPRIFVTDEDLHRSIQHVPESSEPLAVLHPSAGDPRRRWPVSKFAKVGDALANAGARVVIIGAGWESEIDQSVCEAMSSSGLNLSGKLDLNALTGLLSRASLVVSNDSGPLHLAAAVGAPTVGIYWCGNMINAGPLTRSRHRPAISWRLDCPVCEADCTRTNCSHQESFVADVTESEVIRYALDLLQMAVKQNTYPDFFTYSLEGGY